jgi:radical SAM protein with 4Fe4S-binding SPASM domain
MEKSSAMLNRAYVEIGNLCNLSCSFCPGTRREGKQMTVSEFRTVAQRLRPYTDYLYLHVMGEPLFHPELDTILSEAGALGFRVCITTNGTLLDASSDLLLSHAAVLHKVSISLHSMEGNGAESSLGEYLRSAADFARRAAEKGIYTVFRLWNLDTASRTGQNSENASIEAFLHTEFPEEWTVLQNGFRLSRNVFLEYAGIFTWPTESEAEALDDGYCHGLMDQIAVLADGTVVPCCLDSEGEIALGNLFHAELSEILASPRATRMREGFRNHKMTEALCKTCTYARRFRK